jgi:hypothetical protein
MKIFLELRGCFDALEGKENGKIGGRLTLNMMKRGDELLNGVSMASKLTLVDWYKDAVETYATAGNGKTNKKGAQHFQVASSQRREKLYIADIDDYFMPNWNTKLGKVHDDF